MAEPKGAVLFPILLAILVIRNDCVRIVMGSKALDNTRRDFIHHETKFKAGTEPALIRGEVMHRDHPLSPLSSSTPRPFTERLVASVKRSLQRSDYISRSIKAAANGLETPTYPAADQTEYLLEISLGTPQQKFSAILDTASDLVWLQCLPCIHCYNQSGALFDPKKSSTYKSIGCTNPLCNTQNLLNDTCANSGCQYLYSYGDGSNTTGTLAYDTLTLSSTTGVETSIPNFAFGCSDDDLGSFTDSAGGIAGFGRGNVSLPSQLNSKVTAIFSYCLVNATANKTSPLFLGDAARASGVQYTPLLTNPKVSTYYYVGVTGISVGGQKLSISAGTFDIGSTGHGGVILDSGTTITNWNQEAYAIIKQAYLNQISYPTVAVNSLGLDLCFDISQVSSVSVPIMVVHFDNVDYTASPSNTFVETSGALCLAMTSSNSEFSIIGNIFQQDHQLVYDLVKQQVGFASADCATVQAGGSNSSTSTGPSPPSNGGPVVGARPSQAQQYLVATAMVATAFVVHMVGAL